jgi:fructoselysine 3-epimerase
MKIGMFTSGYQRNPLEHAFIDAKRFGYDYIELWGGRPHAFAPDLKAGDINEIKRLIDKYQIKVVGFTPEHNAYPYNFMVGTEAMRQDCVKYLKLCLDMGKEMGAEFTLCSPANAGYYTRYDEMWDRLTKTIRELADHAEKIDHKLVVEALTPYESNSVRSANDLARLFDIVDSPYVVGMCDIVPPFVQHESIMAYFDILKDKMVHMHIIDGKNGADTHLVPGEGDIPLRELFMELNEIGYKGNITIELVTNYINEPRMFARKAINNLRKLLKN